MKKLLHIIATPRAEESRTLAVSQIFIEVLKNKYPDLGIDELNLYKEKLPALTVERVDGKYVLLSGKELSGELKASWKDITKHIERFLCADLYLVSTPMWNFSIPYELKHYIDVILQPKYLFVYTPAGVQGLVKGKKMVVVTTRGGDYSAGSPSKPYDLQEPYLRTVFGFVGLTDIQFIHAQPMDAAGVEVQKNKIKEAQEIAKRVALNIYSGLVAS
jgi:FMN-dependent NADH-azoreductase